MASLLWDTKPIKIFIKTGNNNIKKFVIISLSLQLSDLLCETRFGHIPLIYLNANHESNVFNYFQNLNENFWKGSFIFHELVLISFKFTVMTKFSNVLYAFPSLYGPGPRTPKTIASKFMFVCLLIDFKSLKHTYTI